MASKLLASPFEMYKGIYIALSGMVLREQQINTIAQNLANVSTTGYKKDDVAFKDYLMGADIAPNGVSDGRRMARMGTVATDFSAGPMVNTGNPMDLAIAGDGFFSLEGGLYTRRGDFTINAEGSLVDQAGTLVMGQNGPINIADATGPVVFGPDGSVSVDGQLLDKLNIVKFDDNSALTRGGNGTFKSEAQPQTVINAEVKQGFLEASNVNAITEMVHMISAQREFESFRGVITSFDSAASKITNDLARG